MSKTSDNLIYKAAGIVGVAIAGEALGSVEYDTIKGCIGPVLDEVADIVMIDPEDIPDRYFNTVARLVAVHASAEFSNVPVDAVAIQQHENRLRYLASNKATRGRLKVEYF
jgi:hypothetical protein